MGRAVNETLELDLWLMSCRVLNREMELAMFDALVEQCEARGIRKIVGVYIPSKKNSMVADHYHKLGFTASEGSSEGFQSWHYDVPKGQPAIARYISRTVNSVSAIVDDPLPRDTKTEDADRDALGKRPGCLTYR
jgi:predicted enzyme involved in methoxymalonyl-ACP biosynthesis